MPLPLNLQVVHDYNARLRARESGQWRDMRRRWEQVQNRLADDIERLTAELEGQGPISEWRLVELERYRELLAQVRAEIEGYNADVADEVTGFQVDYGRLGVEMAGEQLTAAYWQAGRVATSFNRLPLEAVQVMAGLTADGSPLAERLASVFPETAAAIGRALIEATALGQGPRETARLLSRVMEGPLWKALRLARTEQLRSFREAARQQYQASGLVSGYRRIAAHQLRTCLACLFADGTIYPVETAFESHVNCRCSLVPIVMGLPEVIWPNGQQWFVGLPADQQQVMMGPAAYAAWQGGQIQLGDFVQRHTDSTWGNSLQTATLAELGLR